MVIIFDTKRCQWVKTLTAFLIVCFEYFVSDFRVG
jgi:hypothetical protein